MSTISTPRTILARAMEVTFGTAQAALKVPGALLPCAVGGVTRALGGAEDEEDLGRVLDLVNGAQVTAGGGASLLLTGAADLAESAAGGLAAGVGASLASQGGSSAELARLVRKRVNEAVDPRDGRLTAAWKGFSCGLQVAVTGGARVGYMEGQGTARGLLESGAHLSERAPELPSAGAWANFQGTMEALACVPGGAARGLAESLGETPVGPAWLAAGLLAGVGLTVGAVLAGPVGAAAGTAMAVGLVGRSNQVAGEAVSEQVQDFLASRPDHGHEVINRNRDFCGGLVVGLATAFQAGYLHHTSSSSDRPA